MMGRLSLAAADGDGVVLFVADEPVAAVVLVTCGLLELVLVDVVVDVVGEVDVFVDVFDDEVVVVVVDDSIELVEFDDSTVVEVACS